MLWWKGSRIFPFASRETSENDVGLRSSVFRSRLFMSRVALFDISLPGLKLLYLHGLKNDDAMHGVSDQLDLEVF